MKRYLTFLLLVIGANVVSQTPSEVIQFEERVYNFGAIQEKMVRYRTPLFSGTRATRR